ncbi:MAG: rhomboid family intramembrane serine protease [Gammaproteobacteria bacterium]
MTAFYYHFIKPFMRVIETSLDEDLSLFSRFLWQNQVRHRIFEERGRQVVEVAETATAADVRSAYEAWRRGELVLTRKAAGHDRHEAQRPRAAAVLAALRRYPVLIAVLGVSLAVFPFSVQVEHGRLTPLVGLLTSVDLERGSPTTTEIWRYVTPIFLHFSLVHLVFNVAVTADLGRRVELARGSLTLLLLIVVIAIASNAGQLLLGGNPLFGGALRCRLRVARIRAGQRPTTSAGRRLADTSGICRLPAPVSGGLLDGHHRAVRPVCRQSGALGRARDRRRDGRVSAAGEAR